MMKRVLLAVVLAGAPVLLPAGTAYAAQEQCSIACAIAVDPCDDEDEDCHGCLVPDFVVRPCLFEFVQ